MSLMTFKSPQSETTSELLKRELNCLTTTLDTRESGPWITTTDMEKEFKYGMMAQFTKGNGRTIRRTEREDSFTQTATCMRETG